MDETINKLANLIYESNKSITEISKDANISRQMIYKILNKKVKTVSTDTINAICRAINKTPSILYTKEKQKNEQNKITLIGRNGTIEEYVLTDEEMAAYQAIFKNHKKYDQDNEGNF